MREQNKKDGQHQLDGRILGVLKELVEHHSSSRCVAEQMGQAHNYVARILRGETKLRLDVLERILDTLGISQTFFLQLVSSSGSPQDLIEVLKFYGGDGPLPETFIQDMSASVAELLTDACVEDQAKDFGFELSDYGVESPRQAKVTELEERRQKDRAGAKAELELLAQEILTEMETEGFDPGSAAELAQALSIWATIQRFEGCRRDSSLAYQVALHLGVHAESHKALGFTLQRTAYLLGDLGCYQASLVFMDYAIRHLIRTGEVTACGTVFADRGAMLLNQADFSAAVDEFKAALNILPESQWRSRAACFGNLAICYEQLSRLAPARTCLEMAEQLYGDSQEIGLAYVLWNRGRLSMADKHVVDAESYFIRALNHLESFGQPLSFANLALSLAEAYMVQGKVQALRDLADRMLAWLPAIRGNRIADAALMEWIRCARWGEVTHQVLNEARQKLGQAAGR